jgi:centromeric protein E
MEARKAKLHDQLAKLNGEILTSEIPRPGSAVGMTPSGRKRPRISEFAARMMTGSLGIGSPKRQMGNDRRAVSTFVRPVKDMPSMGEAMEGVEESGVAVSLFVMEKSAS